MVVSASCVVNPVPVKAEILWKRAVSSDIPVNFNAVPPMRTTNNEQRYRKNDEQSKCCCHGLYELRIGHDFDHCRAIDSEGLLNGIGDVFGFGYLLSMSPTKLCKGCE